MEEAPTGHQGNEVVPPLLIPRGTQTNGTNHLRHHIICVFLMGLDVPTKFEMNMFLIIKMFPSQQVVQGESVRGTIRMQERHSAKTPH